MTKLGNSIPLSGLFPTQAQQPIPSTSHQNPELDEQTAYMNHLQSQVDAMNRQCPEEVAQLAQISERIRRKMAGEPLYPEGSWASRWQSVKDKTRLFGEELEHQIQHFANVTLENNKGVYDKANTYECLAKIFDELKPINSISTMVEIFNAPNWGMRALAFVKMFELHGGWRLLSTGVKQLIVYGSGLIADWQLGRETPGESEACAELQAITPLGASWTRIIACAATAALFIFGGTALATLQPMAVKDNIIKQFGDFSRSVLSIESLFTHSQDYLYKAIAFCVGVENDDPEKIEIEILSNKVNEMFRRILRLNNMFHASTREYHFAAATVDSFVKKAHAVANTARTRAHLKNFAGVSRLESRLSAELSKMDQRLELVRRSITGKIQPAVIWIYGESGVGKSQAAPLIARQFCELTGLPMNCYSRSANKHWDGYEGQTVVIYDDFASAEGSTEASELQAIYTNNTYILPKAAVDDKGQVFNSSLVIICSNFSMLQKGGANCDLQDPTILLRRRDLLVRFTAIPGVKAPQRIDPHFCHVNITREDPMNPQPNPEAQTSIETLAIQLAEVYQKNVQRYADVNLASEDCELRVQDVLKVCDLDQPLPPPTPQQKAEAEPQALSIQRTDVSTAQALLFTGPPGIGKTYTAQMIGAEKIRTFDEMKSAEGRSVGMVYVDDPAIDVDPDQFRRILWYAYSTPSAPRLIITCNDSTWGPYVEKVAETVEGAGDLIQAVKRRVVEVPFAYKIWYWYKAMVHYKGKWLYPPEFVTQLIDEERNSAASFLHRLTFDADLHPEIVLRAHGPSSAPPNTLAGYSVIKGSYSQVWALSKAAFMTLARNIHVGRGAGATPEGIRTFNNMNIRLKIPVTQVQFSDVTMTFKNYAGDYVLATCSDATKIVKTPEGYFYKIGGELQPITDDDADYAEYLYGGEEELPQEVLSPLSKKVLIAIGASVGGLLALVGTIKAAQAIYNHSQRSKILEEKEKIRRETEQLCQLGKAIAEGKKRKKQRPASGDSGCSDDAEDYFHEVCAEFSNLPEDDERVKRIRSPEFARAIVDKARTMKGKPPSKVLDAMTDWIHTGRVEAAWDPYTQDMKRQEAKSVSQFVQELTQAITESPEPDPKGKEDLHDKRATIAQIRPDEYRRGGRAKHEATYDTATLQIMNDRVQPNIVQLCLPGTNQPAPICNGLMVRGVKGISVGHPFHKGMEIVVTKGSKTFPARITLVMVERDLCVFEGTSKQTSAFPDIVQHFATHLDDTVGSNCVLVRPVRAAKRAETFDLSSCKIQSFETFRVTNGQNVGMRYTPVFGGGEFLGQFTTKGDCGAPIMLLNPKLPNKILGLHVASSGMSGYASYLHRDDLRYLLGEATLEAAQRPFMRYQRAEYNPMEEEVLPGFYKVGKLLDPLGGTTRTQMHHTPYRNIIPVEDFQPALLSDRDPRKNFEGTIVEKVISKWASAEVDLDQDLLNECAMGFARRVIAIARENKVSLRVLTQKEAINGCTQYPRSNGIVTTTSAGYPWCAMSSKIVRTHGKKPFLAQARDGLWDVNYDHVAGELLSDAVGVLKAKCMSGAVPPVIFSFSLKDETLKTRNVLKCKTRAICGAPLDFVIVDRMYRHALMATLVEINDKIPVKVGIDPHSLDWHTLFHYMRRISGEGWDADYSNYDASIRVPFFRALEIFYNTVYHALDPNWKDSDDKARSALIRAIGQPLVGIGQDLYECRLGSQPSGQPGTATDNSIINVFIYLYAWMKSTVDRPYYHNVPSFFENCALAVYGDDNIITVSPKVREFFTPSKFNAIAVALGFVLSNADKTGLVDWKNLEDMEFLKRNFVRIGGYYAGRLIRASYNKMLSFMTGPRHNWHDDDPPYVNPSAHAQVLEGCLLGYSLYPEEEWTALRDKIEQISADCGYVYTFPYSYGEAQRNIMFSAATTLPTLNFQGDDGDCPRASPRLYSSSDTVT